MSAGPSLVQSETITSRSLGRRAGCGAAQSNSGLGTRARFGSLRCNCRRRRVRFSAGETGKIRRRRDPKPMAKAARQCAHNHRKIASTVAGALHVTDMIAPRCPRRCHDRHSVPPLPRAVRFPARRATCFAGSSVIGIMSSQAPKGRRAAQVVSATGHSFRQQAKSAMGQKTRLFARRCLRSPHALHGGLSKPEFLS